MSNVLIGIIGVILFIGLALAGALILGDDFRSSSASSKAAAVSGQMQQVVAAINMSNLKTGSPMVASTYFMTNIGNLQPRFLKTVPYNPVLGAPYQTLDARGGTTGDPVGLVVTMLGASSDESARNVCRAIEEQSGSSNPDATSNTVQLAWVNVMNTQRRPGCIRLWDEKFYAYSPV